MSRSDGEPQPEVVFRILYVHTDTDTASSIGSALEAQVSGISVRAVDSVEDVLFSINDVECIVSAFELDETTGIGLCSRVREVRPDVAFFLHADGLTEKLVEEAFTAGVTDCVERNGGVSLLGRRLTRYVSSVQSTDTSDAGITADIPAELFDSVLSTCPIGVMVFDADGELVLSNEQTETTLGRSREEMAGLSFDADDWDIRNESGDPIPSERLPVNRVLEGGERVRNVTLTVARSDGTRAYISVTAAPIERDGETVGAICTVQDVTERKRTKRELERRVRQQEVLATFGRQALSETDIEALLNRAAQLVTETLDLSGCEVLERLPDENVLLVRADSGAPERAGEEIPIDESAVSHLKEDGPLIVTDLVDWHHCPGVDRSLERGIESGVCVSIGHPDRPWGLLTGYDDETRGFTDLDVTFIRNISTVLATAIERTDRESQLHRLNELTRALVRSETSGTVAEAAVKAVERTFDRTVAAIYLYDDDRSDFVVRSGIECANELEERSGFDVDDVVWQAFVESERVLVGPAFDENETGEFDANESNEGGCVAIPLGTHGVLLVEGTVGFDSTELDLLELLAANVRSVLDRSVREQRLREREEALSERNELLDRANWLNDIIRSIDRALVDATTREEIEHAVCVELSGAGPYRFAWFGTYNSPNGSITPRAWAGCGGLDTLEEGDVLDQRPAIDAANLREPQIVDNLLSDPPFEPWRKEAITRGYRSCIALPVVFRDSLYGVLSIYADEVGAFSPLERSVFSELGETIAYAINAVESKRALVGDRIVELAFRISDPDIEPVALAASTGGSVEIAGIVPRSDGRLRVFATVDGTSLEAIERWAERSVLAESVGTVTERDDGYRVEWTATDESFIATLVDHGAVPRHLSVEEGNARVVVELPRHADVRTFAEMLNTRYDSAEVLSRRDRERSVGGENSFRSALERELTDRQLEVLRTAYFGGYFESPRENTGREIAAMLDISQPTFTTHLRTASRKLFELLFREDDADG